MFFYLPLRLHESPIYDEHTALLLTIYHVTVDSTAWFMYPQYYQDANEADVWMNDKAGIAANQDYGRDEDAAVKALKKHRVRAPMWDSHGNLQTDGLEFVAYI